MTEEDLPSSQGFVTKIFRWMRAIDLCNRFLQTKNINGNRWNRMVSLFHIVNVIEPNGNSFFVSFLFSHRKNIVRLSVRRAPTRPVATPVLFYGDEEDLLIMFRSRRSNAGFDPMASSSPSIRPSVPSVVLVSAVTRLVADL